jgi:hypothetical protein
MRVLILSVLFTLIPYSSLACMVRVFDVFGEQHDIQVLETALMGVEVGKWGSFHFMADLNEPERVAFTVSWGTQHMKGVTLWRKKIVTTFLWIEPYVFQLACEKQEG